jgi:hypothetical protein
VGDVVTSMILMDTVKIFDKFNLLPVGCKF